MTGSTLVLNVDTHQNRQLGREGGELTLILETTYAGVGGLEGCRMSQLQGYLSPWG
jgi:hypothetical protein